MSHTTHTTHTTPRETERREDRDKERRGDEREEDREDKTTEERTEKIHVQCGGAWPLLVGVVIYLVNSVCARDLSLLNSVKYDSI